MKELKLRDEIIREFTEKNAIREALIKIYDFICDSDEPYSLLLELTINLDFDLFFQLFSSDERKHYPGGEYNFLTYITTYEENNFWFHCPYRKKYVKIHLDKIIKLKILKPPYELLM